MIVKDIANRISELQLERMDERKDKFISNVYKARIDFKILLKGEPEESRNENDLYWCPTCQRLLTKQQALKISCIKKKNDPNQHLESNGNSSSQVSTARSSDKNPLSDSSNQVNHTEEVLHQNLLMQQDEYIETNGESYYYHDIIFEEEVFYLAKDRINYKES